MREDATAAEFMELHLAGVTYDDIADRYGITKCRVENKVRRYMAENLIKRTKGVVYKKQPKVGITASDIEKVRKSIFVGTIIQVVSGRGSADDDTYAGRTRRMAKVVSTSNKRFCIVDLGHGIKEAILWTELVDKMTAGKE